MDKVTFGRCNFWTTQHFLLGHGVGVSAETNAILAQLGLGAGAWASVKILLQALVPGSRLTVSAWVSPSSAQLVVLYLLETPPNSHDLSLFLEGG